MHRILYIAIVSVLLCSCQSEQEKTVLNWEQINNSCEASRIVILSEPKPYTAKDSMRVLNTNYLALQKDRVQQLQIELDTLEKTILLKQNEYLTLSNETMKRYFKRGLERMEYRAMMIERNIEIYQNHPELTQLQTIKKAIDFYSNDTSRLLGYVFEIQFVGKQGDLDEMLFQKKYFFDTLQTSIFAEL